MIPSTKAMSTMDAPDSKKLDDNCENFGRKCQLSGQLLERTAAPGPRLDDLIEYVDDHCLNAGKGCPTQKPPQHDQADRA